MSGRAGSACSSERGRKGRTIIATPSGSVRMIHSQRTSSNEEKISPIPLDTFMTLFLSPSLSLFLSLSLYGCEDKGPNSTCRNCQRAFSRRMICLEDGGWIRPNGAALIHRVDSSATRFLGRGVLPRFEDEVENPGTHHDQKSCPCHEPFPPRTSQPRPRRDMHARSHGARRTRRDMRTARSTRRWSGRPN